MKLVMNVAELLQESVSALALRNLVAAGALLAAAGASGQCEVAELLAGDPSEWAFFGHSVATSLDGQYIVAGAFQDDENGASAGAAYVLAGDGQDWSEQAKLLASDGEAGDDFGFTTVMTSDPEYAVISAPNNNGGLGGVYVFQRRGSKWTEIDKLAAMDGSSGDFLGLALAVSSDAVTIAAGADTNEKAGENVGSLYIFVREGEEWVQQVKLTASDAEAADGFGNAVALSSDGNLVLVGAKADDDGASNAGSVYVFERNGERWTEVNKLHASIPDQNANFGAAIALSDDGNTALIGARNEGAAGAAYIFVRQGEAWIEQARLTAPPLGEGGFYGASVSLSGDGNAALVGAPEDQIRGAAYLYLRQGDQWIGQARLASCQPAPDDQFAVSIALSGDGSMAVAGAIWEDGQFINQGAAHVFDLTVEPCFDGDVNCDGVVDALDLITVLNDWGPCDNCWIGCPDFNGDCVVGAIELIIVLGNWG